MTRMLVTGDENTGKELELNAANLATPLRVRTQAVPGFAVLRTDDFGIAGTFPGQTPPAVAVFYVMRLWVGGGGGVGGPRWSKRE